MRLHKSKKGKIQRVTQMKLSVNVLLQYSYTQLLNANQHYNMKGDVTGDTKQKKM